MSPLGITCLSFLVSFFVTRKFPAMPFKDTMHKEAFIIAMVWPMAIKSGAWVNQLCILRREYPLPLPD